MIEETKAMAEEAGFSVIDEVEIGTLEDVKDTRLLVPPTRGVKLRIDKATAVMNKEAIYRSINLQFRLVDGVVIKEGEDPKFKGSVVFTRVCYYADPEVYTEDFFKRRQHLVSLKYLTQATVLTNPTKVNDTFCKELTGQVILGDIIQRKNKPYYDEGGNEIIPEPSNEVMRFKAVPMEQQV